MKISALIFLSIFTILVLFSLTTFINFKQSEEVTDNVEYLSISSNIVRQSNQFQRNILYMERGLRGYAISGENYFLQAYDSASIENNQLLNELATLIPSNSDQVQKLREIQDLYMQWIADFARPLISARQTADSEKKPRSMAEFYKNSQALRDEERISNGLQQKFRELISPEYVNRAQRKIILERSERNTKVISFSLTASSILIGFLIAIILSHHIENRISKMVTLANSIAEGNYQAQMKDMDKDELGKLARSLNYMAEMLAGNISLLKRKNLELDQFAHIVSHDLKAPLRGIDNVISWIEEDYAAAIPAKVNEYLQLIKGRVNRLENLIQGILSYARIGKETQEKEKVDVSELLGEVLENLAVGPKMTVELQRNMPLIDTEKLPLAQIFTNLISNAIKYHDKPDGIVKVYYREEKDRYIFFVEDDGPGIAKSYHHKIFVIFQTLQERDSFESTGVGLAIVKKILDDRQEQIRIESEPGKGSVFSFTWPKN